MTIEPDQTVLFLGDSITHAHRRPEEIHDCYQLGCGYVNHVAAELSSAHPDAGLRFVNCGECGFTIRDVLNRWQQDCVTIRAAVVSILIGINDTHSPTHDPDAFKSDYQQLVNSVRGRLPAAKLMLLEPFGVAVKRVAGFEIITPQQLDRLAAVQLIVHELAKANGAVFVPLQHLFNPPPATAWTLDGIHPSAAGHLRIARAWTVAARRAGWFPSKSQQGEDI